MDKEKALKNQGSEFREDIILGGGKIKPLLFSAEVSEMRWAA